MLFIRKRPGHSRSSFSLANWQTRACRIETRAISNTLHRAMPRLRHRKTES